MSDDTPQAVQAQARAAPNVTALAHAARAQAQRTREHIPDALGTPPMLIDVRIGRCTAVHDPDHHRAMFDLGLPAGPVPVYYWPATPTVGSHWGVRTASQHLERWTRTGRGFVRWLYYRPRTLGVLDIWRVRWPLTADRVPESVAAVLGAAISPAFSVNIAGLIGSHAGTGQVYAVSMPWGAFTPLGLPDAPPAATTWTLAFAEWGFGDRQIADTGAMLDVVGVLDDAELDPTAVGLIATAPAAITTYFITATVPTLEVHIPRTVEVVESADAGGSWATRASYEYVHPLFDAGSGSALFASAYPLINEPAGGAIAPNYTTTWHHAPGCVLVAETAGVAAGTRVFALPHATIQAWAETGPVVPAIYTPYVLLLPAGGIPARVALGTPADMFGGDGALGVVPIPLWVRQAADGTWVVYAYLQAGAMVEISPGRNGAPQRWYRGTGALEALAWEPVGAVVAAADFDVDITGELTDPWQILAISVEGQSLVAWSAGRDGDGYRQRLASDDYGETWAAIPAGLGLLSEGDDPGVYNDLLFVDIPADDARA